MLFITLLAWKLRPINRQHRPSNSSNSKASSHVIKRSQSHWNVMDLEMTPWGHGGAGPGRGSRISKALLPGLGSMGLPGWAPVGLAAWTRRQGLDSIWDCAIAVLTCGRCSQLLASQTPSAWPATVPLVMAVSIHVLTGRFLEAQTK